MSSNTKTGINIEKTIISGYLTDCMRTVRGFGYPGYFLIPFYTFSIR